MLFTKVCDLLHDLGKAHTTSAPATDVRQQLFEKFIRDHITLLPWPQQPAALTVLLSLLMPTQSVTAARLCKLFLRMIETNAASIPHIRSDYNAHLAAAHEWPATHVRNHAPPSPWVHLVSVPRVLADFFVDPPGATPCTLPASEAVQYMDNFRASVRSGDETKQQADLYNFVLCDVGKHECYWFAKALLGMLRVSMGEARVMHALHPLAHRALQWQHNIPAVCNMYFAEPQEWEHVPRVGVPFAPMLPASSALPLPLVSYYTDIQWSTRHVTLEKRALLRVFMFPPRAANTGQVGTLMFKHTKHMKEYRDASQMTILAHAQDIDLSAPAEQTAETLLLKKYEVWFYARVVELLGEKVFKYIPPGRGLEFALTVYNETHSTHEFVTQQVCVQMAHVCMRVN